MLDTIFRGAQKDRSKAMEVCFVPGSIDTFVAKYGREQLNEVAQMKADVDYDTIYEGAQAQAMQVELTDDKPTVTLIGVDHFDNVIKIIDPVINVIDVTGIPVEEITTKKKTRKKT